MSQRKKFTPPMRHRNTADRFAYLRTLGKASGFSAAEQIDITLPGRVSFESLRTGTAVESDFHTLASIINVSMIAAEKIDPTLEQLCLDARDACMEILHRHTRLGVWGLDHQAMDKIPQVLDLYEQLTSLLNGQQLKNLMQECISRMAAGQHLGTPIGVAR